MIQEERQQHKLHDADSFLQYRKEQEKVHLDRIKNSKDPLDSILTVEINTTELCNRKCVFCPRFAAEVYPNRNLNMTVDTASKIATHLSDAGLTMLYINLYDGPDQAEGFVSMMEEAGVSPNRYSLRAHYDLKDYGLKLNNRSGVIDWIGFEDHDIDELKGKPCYYPFYKLFIDWNGDALFCSNDWGKERIIGNLAKQSLYDVWMSDDMKGIRSNLKKGDRSQSPCNKCSVKGTLFGKPSFDLINKHYESSDNRSK